MAPAITRLASARVRVMRSILSSQELIRMLALKNARYQLIRAPAPFAGRAGAMSMLTRRGRRGEATDQQGQVDVVGGGGERRQQERIEAVGGGEAAGNVAAG